MSAHQPIPDHWPRARWFTPQDVDAARHRSRVTRLVTRLGGYVKRRPWPRIPTPEEFAAYVIDPAVRGARANW